MTGRGGLLALALLVLPATPALAAANCTVSSLATAFGNYSPVAPAALDGAGQVTVRCSLLLGVSFLVAYELRLSTGGSGSYAPRRMASGANTLSYNLYTNTTRTLVWGNGTAGTSTVTDGYLLGLTPVVRNYAVYGRVFAQQAAPSGSYADTVTVTIEY